MNQIELIARLDGLKNLGLKIQDETTGLKGTIEDLRSALEASENLSPEVIAALAAVETQFSVVDALVPDIEVEVPVVSPEEPITDPTPVAEEPVAEEPVAEEPVAEEPVAEEPVAEEPVAEEPVV